MLPKKKRIEYIDFTLQSLYPNPPIPLSHKDPFTLLLAVMLSAQCTDERVNQITPKLFTLADNPRDMAKQNYDTVYDIIKPCGLGPQKAKAILATSQALNSEFSGEVPQSVEELESLRGVGHKTAQVVAAQAFGQSTFPVDTHIHRLARRWKLSPGKSVIRTERDLKKAFAKERWNKLHLQIIFYGREHCTARGCDGHSCQICAHITQS